MFLRLKCKTRQMAGVESCVVWRRSVLALCFLPAACGPKPVIMPVAHFKPGQWESGEIKDCQKAEWQGSIILLCDIDEYDAQLLSLHGLPEPQATIRSNELRSHSENAKTFAVRFHSKAGSIWKCQRMADGIDCR